MLGRRLGAPRAATIPSTRSRRRRLQPPFEHPGRAEAIRAALAADAPVRDRRAAECGHGADRGRPRPGLVRFLATAWDEYQRERRADPRRGARRVRDARAAGRDGRGRASRRRSPAGSGGGASRRRRRSPRARTTAARSAVDCALSATAAGARRRAVGLRAVPAARSPRRHLAVRRLLLLQQRRDRRRTTSPPTTGARSPCSTSTTTTATARSRSSTSATTWRSSRCTATRRGPTRTTRASPTRPAPGGAAARRATCRWPPAPTTTPTSPRSTGRSTPSTRFDPALVVVSLGVDTFVDDPICDLGAHHRRASPAAAPPSPPSAGRSSSCRRAATPTTPSAPTSCAWLLGAAGSARRDLTALPQLLCPGDTSCRIHRRVAEMDVTAQAALMSARTWAQRSGSVR